MEERRTFLRAHTVATANSKAARQCISFLIILHHYHSIKLVPVTLILEILRKGAICDTCLGIEKISREGNQL